jgi:hypothetical protein
VYKYKEEYKQGEMWHSAQRAEISEKICMFQPGRCQATSTRVISAETNNEELLLFIILLLLTAIGLMPGGSEYNTIT